MNHETMSSDSDLSIRAIQDLNREIHNQIDANRHRRRMIIGVGAVLTAIMAVTMTNTTKQAKAFGVEDLAIMGRVQLQERLPGGRETLQAYLADEAPYLVAQGFQGALQMLPEIREGLTDGVNEHIESVNAQFEGRAIVLLREALLKSRENIDLAYPDAPNRHELIAHDAAEYFEIQFAQAAEQILPLYAAVMGHLTTFVETVGQADPDDLNERQRLQRDLIETLILLAGRGDSPVP
jgi:hypothetical protein